jgi:hypothetical protein
MDGTRDMIRPNTPRRSPERHDDAAGVAADCYRMADQIGGGPVRAALMEMGRDYATRARDTARTAAFRLELERSEREASGFWPLRLLADLLAPLPAQPVRHAAPTPRPAATSAMPASQPPVRRTTTPVAPRAASKPAARSSRLFRMHALAIVDS